MDNNFIMHLVTMTVLSLVSTLEGANHGKSNQVVTDEAQTSNLTCYTCTTFDDYTCRTFNASTDEALSIARRECGPEETFCSTTRVEYMTNERIFRKFWALERGCSSSCLSGCIILGEGERTKLHLCNSCCSSSLCNVNDLGLSLGPSLRILIFFGIIVEHFLFSRPFHDS